MIRYLSFDLQGVLSASDFSDNFWLEQLPRLYAQKHHLSLPEAKTRLKAEFSRMGTYDLRYYNDAYWEQQLGFKTPDILRAMALQPTLNEPLLAYIQASSIPSVILSTTTLTFIEYELGTKKALFEHLYSCVDAFHTAGKTPEVFRQVAEKLGVQPHEILHSGDNLEMDIRNARHAGVQTLHYTGQDNLAAAILQKIKEAA